MGCGSSSRLKRGPSLLSEKPPEIKKSDFAKSYHIGRLIGSGHFAEVFQCKDVHDQTEWAVKKIHKAKLPNKRLLMSEIMILFHGGRHPHVLGLRDVFEDASFYYLVSELCKEGDLFNCIVEDGQMSEARSASVLRQMAEALIHLHSLGIVHRDLKPENVLLERRVKLDSSGQPIDGQRTDCIKLADFGLSKLLPVSTLPGALARMNTICGTWAYAAPEVVARTAYDCRVDIWTLGILLYILLAGYHPFDPYGELSEPELLRHISRCKYDFNDSVWQSVSEEAKNVIRSLLQVDPARRISLQDLLENEWVLGQGVSSKTNVQAIENLARFNEARRKLGLATRTVIAAGRFKRGLTQKVSSDTEDHKKESPTSRTSAIKTESSEALDHESSDLAVEHGSRRSGTGSIPGSSVHREDKQPLVIDVTASDIPWRSLDPYSGIDRMKPKTSPRSAVATDDNDNNGDTCLGETVTRVPQIIADNNESGGTVGCVSGQCVAP